MIDIHSHILPGIDDGAETLEDSITMIRELTEQGVTDIIATPHYVDETIYTSSRRENLHLLDELRRTLAEEKITVNIYLGNEIYICDKIDDLILFNKTSSLADSNFLLVELPMSGEFPNYEDILQDLINHGYKVILAHPERYTTFQNDFSLIERLHEMGILLQCNTGSFIRQYGKHAEKIATTLAKKNMIYALGSDMHHTRGSSDITLAIKKLHKYYKDDELEQILVNNPKTILEHSATPTE